MTCKISIGGISEQDLDLFLLEELVSNLAFRHWLIGQLKSWPIEFSELIAANRSVRKFHAKLKSSLELITFERWSRHTKIEERAKYEMLWGRDISEKRNRVKKILPPSDDFDTKITKDFTNCKITHLLKGEPERLVFEGNYHSVAMKIIRATDRLTQLLCGRELARLEVPPLVVDNTIRDDTKDAQVGISQ